jgi:penicillin amidase
MVHLQAPGWNVIGGGEPTIPGVSIGHNEFGAWGLTIFSLDGEDLYVYELNPENPKQYRYQNRWEDLLTIKDTIQVKGSAPVYVEHMFTRHGPVTYVDKNHKIAYAVRCAWMEIGSAPYLASLRIDQATTLKEFKESCMYSYMPAENMIWADKKGDIGWQVAGMAPIRENWGGLVPVPGDGRYEWSGYLPIASLPNASNPTKGFLATANENLVPNDYPSKNAVGAAGWADPFRANRINAVLTSRTKHSQQDMMNLQMDYYSLPASVFVPLLEDVRFTDRQKEDARIRLLKWNYILDKNSIEAAIYSAWERKISENMLALVVPEKGKGLIKSIPLSKTIDWLIKGRPEFGRGQRDLFLTNAFSQALESLVLKIGADTSRWQYGQLAYHHVLIKHPLSNVVDEATRKKLEVGPAARGGNGSTPGMTTNLDNQAAGASFRMVVDLADWDKTMFTNTPGQSGDPESQFYKNLFKYWAEDKHVPVYFSKPKVEASKKEKVLFIP